ncbi:DUF4150 domain-containing protein [Deferribacter abyssi]|uniref:DUF4150 domain-containing protein n=1 Tax=Deferribacter abyssi TaxID=213806 RepID=UPI003C15D6F6
MFMLTMGAGVNLGFPDVCLTPVVGVPVPIPYPDINVSATTAPAVYNILVDCMPAINQLSMGLVSVGDDAGLELGVVSHMISGQTLYEVGCFTIMVGGAPAQRLTSVTAQNAMGMLPNSPGMCIAPSQVTVLSLG